MNSRIGIVVDSNSQMSPSLARQLGAVVVPLEVEIDGISYREGIDLDADEFYSRWGDDRAPNVATSQPSPGTFVYTYEQLIADGATEILSVHITEAMSGTLNSARVAAESVSVPVRLVDSNTASFGISCCAWAAVDAIRAGADLEAAAAVAEERAARIGTAFVAGVPALVDDSGRAVGLDMTQAAEDGVPVLAMSGGVLEVLDSVDTSERAVGVMRDYALGWASAARDGLHVSIGTSDSSSFPIGELLTGELTGDARVVDLVQYRIGPSLGAHTGPGTVGLFVF